MLHLAAASLAVLFALVSPATCQYSYVSGFHPDSLTAGTLAIFCIFTFFFLLLTGWCFVALLLARGHRLPYALLFPTVILSFIGNADDIASIVCDNLSSYYDLPALLFLALDAISLFFGNWATLLLYLALLATLWNRQNAIHVATEGKAGRHNPALIVVHAVLAALILVLGIAGPGVFVNATTTYVTSDSDLQTATVDYQKQRKVFENLSYAYSAFVILTGVDIAISTILLWSASRKARVTDKITNIMFYVVVPLYALLNLFNMIFTIVFSDKGISSSSINSYESAILANNLLVLLVSFAIIATLLFLSVNRTNWVVQGGVVQPDAGKSHQQYWSPSYNGPYQGQPVAPPMYYNNGQHPFIANRPPQPVLYQQAPYQQAPYPQAPYPQALYPPTPYQQTPYQHPPSPQQPAEQPSPQQPNEHPQIPQPQEPVTAAALTS